jgi:hypothetical protein
MIQDDRAGLGDGHRATSDDTRRLVESGRGKRRLVLGQLERSTRPDRPTIASKPLNAAVNPGAIGVASRR